MRRTVTRALTSLAVLVGGLSLAACSPPSNAVTAVLLDGGHPVAIFHPCDGTEVDGVSVMETDAGASTAPSPGGSLVTASPGGSLVTAKPGGSYWHVSGEAAPIRRLRLLRETPQGWSQQITSPGALLVAFREGWTYRVSADTSPVGAGRDAGVLFTLADLRALPEGEVLATRRPHADAEPMTRRDFRRYASRSC